MKKAAGFLALLLLWEGWVRLSASPVLSSSLDILKAAAGMARSGELWTNAGVSLMRVSFGFLIAAASGVSLGILVYLSRTISAVVMPVVDAARPVAALTLFPLIILLLGIGESSKVFIIFWTAWPACLLNTLQGLRDVDPQIIEAAALDGANPLQRLASVTFPLAVPTVLTGLRIGLSGGWISLVAAEMLGSNSGLGYAVLMHSSTFRYSEMYADIVTIASIGLAMNLILARLQIVISYNGGSNESRALSFNDRSAGWPVFSLFTSRKPHFSAIRPDEHEIC